MENEFRKNYKRPIGVSWLIDKTNIKIKVKWHYLYHTVDKKGYTIDFMLSKKRDEIAARNFFEKAIISSGLPEKITIDKRCANKAGIEAINLQIALIALLGCPLAIGNT